MEARSLLKLYGIRFDILVTGRVGGAGWGGQGRGGGGQQPWPEAQPRCLSGREVWNHPHNHHSGHWSSLAGRGEFGQCGLPLASGSICQAYLNARPVPSACC